MRKVRPFLIVTLLAALVTQAIPVYGAQDSTAQVDGSEINNDDWKKYYSEAGGYNKYINEHYNDSVGNLIKIDGNVEYTYENKDYLGVLDTQGNEWLIRFLEIELDGALGKDVTIYGSYRGHVDDEGVRVPVVFATRLYIDDIVVEPTEYGVKLIDICEGEPLKTKADILEFVSENYQLVYTEHNDDPVFKFNVEESASEGYDYTVTISLLPYKEMNIGAGYVVPEEDKEWVKEAIGYIAQHLQIRCKGVKFDGGYYDSYTKNENGQQVKYEYSFANWVNTYRNEKTGLQSTDFGFYWAPFKDTKGWVKVSY